MEGVAHLDLRQLKIFTTVAEVLSFTRAAELLGYAQSNVTAQIRLLEAEFNTKLFERLGKKVALTPDGEKLFFHASQLLKRASDINSIMSKESSPSGTITIGLPESLCVFRLTALFKQYCKMYPQVKLVLRLGSSADFHRWLRDNTVDIAFFLDGKIASADFIARVLCQEPMVIVGEPEHRLVNKGCIKPEDIEQESFIFTPCGCSYRAALEKQLAAAGIQPALVYEFDSLESIKQFAAAGLGIALLPRAAVAVELDNGLLADLNWQGPPIEMYTQVVYHKDKWMSAALSCLLTIIAEHFPERRTDAVIEKNTNRK